MGTDTDGHADNGRAVAAATWTDAEANVEADENVGPPKATTGCNGARNESDRAIGNAAVVDPKDAKDGNDEAGRRGSDTDAGPSTRRWLMLLAVVIEALLVAEPARIDAG